MFVLSSDGVKGHSFVSGTSPSRVVKVAVLTVKDCQRTCTWVAPGQDITPALKSKLIILAQESQVPRCLSSAIAACASRNGSQPAGFARRCFTGGTGKEFCPSSPDIVLKTVK